MDYELYIEENEADYKILVDVYCNYYYTPGRYSGKPEDCYPEDSEFSIDYFQIREIEIINEEGKKTKLHEYDLIQNFIEMQGFDIEEILLDQEDLMDKWIDYTGDQFKDPDF